MSLPRTSPRKLNDMLVACFIETLFSWTMKFEYMVSHIRPIKFNLLILIIVRMTLSL